jgi:hypothetical protein
MNVHANGMGSDQGDLIAQNAALRAEVEKLKAKALARSQARINCKVSEKGALSIYGLGRFPVTLYLSQFEALNSAWPAVQEFVQDHRAEFTVKE